MTTARVRTHWHERHAGKVIGLVEYGGDNVTPPWFWQLSIVDLSGSEHAILWGDEHSKRAAENKLTAARFALAGKLVDTMKAGPKTGIAEPVSEGKS